MSRINSQLNIDIWNININYEIYYSGASVKKTVGGVDYFVIPANYSGWYLTRDDVPEQKLSYFTEDVGLNSFYFLMNHNYPSFMSSKTYNLLGSARGEYYFFTHKQLLTRYVKFYTII